MGIGLCCLSELFPLANINPSEDGRVAHKLPPPAVCTAEVVAWYNSVHRQAEV